MQINTLSFSRLDLWESCKYKYRLKYHDKIKSPIPEPDYFEFGKFIHKAFELNVLENTSIQECFGKAYKDFNKFDKNYLKEIIDITRHFESFNNAINKNVYRQYVEKNFSIPLYNPNNLFLESENKQITYYGYIDRIIHYPNNVLIVDYKTTSPKNEKKDISSDQQLIIYTYAVHKILEIPIEKIHSMLFYPRTGNKILVNFNKEKIYSSIEKHPKIAHEILLCKPENASPTISWKCDYCEYRTLCKFYNRSKK